jgi:hypothetical protein
MATPETYYYGQGKVWVARRDKDGQPIRWFWLGDVSALSIALSTESFNHKESYSGKRSNVRRILTSQDGTINMTMHDHNGQNLALVLHGENTDTAAGSVTAEPLPAVIEAGQRVYLAHQNVSNVVMTGLVEGTDYEVDEDFGAVTFLLTPATPPTDVAYDYGEVMSASMFTTEAPEIALKFEGLNLAENEQKVLVELFKVAVDPTSALSLINNDTSLAGLEVTGGVLLDTSKPESNALGRFGHITYMPKKV